MSLTLLNLEVTGHSLPTLFSLLVAKFRLQLLSFLLGKAVLKEKQLVRN
jgi:hypothetical protein